MISKCLCDVLEHVLQSGESSLRTLAVPGNGYSFMVSSWLPLDGQFLLAKVCSTHLLPINITFPDQLGLPECKCRRLGMCISMACHEGGQPVFPFLQSEVQIRQDGMIFFGNNSLYGEIINTSLPKSAFCSHCEPRAPCDKSQVFLDNSIC